MSGLAACGLKVGEKPASESPVGYSGEGYGCIGEIPVRIQSYIADEMPVEGINQFIGCLQHSFTSFAQLTRGGDRSTYAPEELRAFFEAYFLKGRKISDQLLYEFMVIKQFLVGGSDKRLTRAELYAAVQFLEDLRIEAIRIKPHLRMLNPELAVNQDVNGFGPRLAEAYEALRMTAQVLARRLERSGNSYDLGHFAAFMTEFRAFIQWEEHFKSSHSPKEWTDFLSVAKEVMVSGEKPDVIRPGEFLPLLQSLARCYLGYLQYQVGVKSQSLLKGVGLQNFMYLADQVFALVEDATNRQPSKTIAFPVLDRLLSAAYAMGWFPPAWRLVSLTQGTRVLVTRVFGDQSVTPSERRTEGLTLQTLANVKAEFYRWAYVQMNLDREYISVRRPGETKVPDLQADDQLPLEVRTKMKALGGSEWDDFIKVRERMRPLYSTGGDNRVWVAGLAALDKFSIIHGFENLSRMNILRSATGLAFRGYAEDPSRYVWTSGIRESEMKQLFLDLREAAIDVGLTDKRAFNTGNRIFAEGNLFTFDSDGIQAGDGIKSELNFVESMELFAFLYSGGRMSGGIRNRLENFCPRNGPEDVDGHRKFERQCVKQHLAHVMTDETYHLPDLQAYLKGLLISDRQAYADSLLEAAYSPANSEERWVENSEISTVAVVSEYAEAVVNRFDRDGNGILASDELEEAIPHFMGYIKKMADEKLGIHNMSDSRARAVLVFIMYYKYIPESASWGDSWTVWRYESFGEPALALDRLAMAQVFRAIGQKLMTSGVATPAPEPPPENSSNSFDFPVY